MAKPKQTDDDQETDQGSAILNGLQALLERNSNNASQVAQLLYTQNYDLREARRRLQQEVKDLQARIPDGAVVLTGDDVETWKSYQALGSPDDLKKLVDETPQLKKDLEVLRTQEKFRRLEDGTGVKGSVLSKLGPDLEYKVKETTADGVTSKTVVVVLDGKDVPLRDHAQSAWPEFIPSLFPTSVSESPASEKRQDSPRKLVRQGEPSSKPTAGPKDYIARKYAIPRQSEGAS